MCARPFLIGHMVLAETGAAKRCGDVILFFGVEGMVNRLGLNPDQAKIGSAEKGWLWECHLSIS